jgi:hypothetical protein
VLHKYVAPPLATNRVESLLQIEFPFELEIIAIGIGLMLILIEAVSVQNPSLTDTI